MAIRAAYGFESGLVPSTITAGAGTVTADTSIVRNGTYSLKHTHSSATHLVFPSLNLTTNTDTLIVGTGYYSTLINSGANRCISIQGGTTAWVSLYIATDGSLAVYTATTATGTTNTLGTAATSITVSTWHYILFKVKFHDTTGIVEVWVDGVQKINLTGQDTIASGTATTTRSFEFSKGVGNSSAYWDDMVFADSTGSDLTDVFDPVKIEALRPTSDVAEAWTPSTGTDSYALVDEHPVSATDYISATVAATKDEWGMADRTHTGPILGLVANAVGVNLDGGAASLKVGLKRGGAESQSGALGLASSTTHVQYPVENDPTTGVAWTDANANAVTMTVEVA